MLAQELPNCTLIEANSILEWRMAPDRLDSELAAFLDEVWQDVPTRSAATNTPASTSAPNTADESTL
jgi:hypothetical protein